VKRISQPGSQSAHRPHRPPTPRATFASPSAGPSYRPRLSWPHPFHVKLIPRPELPVFRTTLPRPDRLHRGHPISVHWDRPRITREADLSAGLPVRRLHRGHPISVHWDRPPSHVKRISQPGSQSAHRPHRPPRRGRPSPPHLSARATAFGSHGPTVSRETDARPEIPSPPNELTVRDPRLPICRPEPPPSALVAPPVSRETDPPARAPRLPNDATATRPAPPRPPRSRFNGTAHPSHDPTPRHRRRAVLGALAPHPSHVKRPTSRPRPRQSNQAKRRRPAPGNEEPEASPNSTPERRTSPISLRQHLTTTMGRAYHPRYLSPVSRETPGPGSPDRLPQKC